MRSTGAHALGHGHVGQQRRPGAVADGPDSGAGGAGSVKFTETKPGKHAVRLTKGEDETEMEVKVNKGEVIKFEFEFTDG